MFYAPVKPVYAPFKYRLHPFQNPFVPLWKPVLAPFFSCSRCSVYCSPIISTYVPLRVPPLGHVGPPLLHGPVGGLHLLARDQFGAMCSICLLPRTVEANEMILLERRGRRVHRMPGKRGDSRGPTKRVGGAQQKGPNRKCQ